MKLNLQLMEESGMHIDTFVATGGGTRNDAWTQLKSDILNKKVIVRDVEEAGCYGAALLAQSAQLGISIEKLIRTDKQDKIFMPDLKNSQIYEEKFKSYKLLYPLLKQFWQ
jgi:sugar (pentulose or hexulose) kinase